MDMHSDVQLQQQKLQWLKKLYSHAPIRLGKTLKPTDLTAKIIRSTKIEDSMAISIKNLRFPCESVPIFTLKLNARVRSFLPTV
jgi:hypothetical protein